MSAISAHFLTMEMDRIGARTRKLLVVSCLVHAVLLLFLALYPQVAPGPEVVTEIDWVEPEEVQLAATVPPITKKEPEQKVQITEPQEPTHFERELRRAEVEPQPQSDQTIRDKLNERLASLQEMAVQKASLTPINVDLPVSSRPALAAPAPTAVSPRELTRAEPVRGTPLELRRNAERRSVPVAAEVVLPAATKPARAENPQAVQNLAGMTLVGPVADRRVVSYSVPRYPEWAKREAVEGSVRLRFVVLADGTLKENIMIQKTSGYEDFDRNATAALKTWRFEPLARGEEGEQWGEITFHYRLNAG